MATTGLAICKPVPKTTNSMAPSSIAQCITSSEGQRVGVYRSASLHTKAKGGIIRQPIHGSFYLRKCIQEDE